MSSTSTGVVLVASEPPTVYLAGAIDDAPDHGVPWRRQLREHYSDEYDLIDPLEKYDVPVADLEYVDGWSNPDNPHTIGTEELVEKDKRAVLSSDGVLVGYHSRRTIGTPMEVLLAWQQGKPVALWIRDDTTFEAISPWFHCHVTAMSTDPLMALRHVGRQVTSDGPVAGAVGRARDSRMEPVRGGVP